jgi:hypothetical protein
MTRRFRQMFTGFTALAALITLLFAILRWRVNMPEEHLNFGGTTDNQVVIRAPR